MRIKDARFVRWIDERDGRRAIKRGIIETKRRVFATLNHNLTQNQRTISSGNVFSPFGMFFPTRACCCVPHDDDDDDGARCIKNRHEGGKKGRKKRRRTASRSRGGKEPPVKLSFAAIIAFRLVSSGSLRIPLSNVLQLPSSFLLFFALLLPSTSFLHPSYPSAAALGASRVAAELSLFAVKSGPL